MSVSRKQIRVVDALHIPTKASRLVVVRLVACGLSPEQIAFVLGCMPHEVTEHYSLEVEHGTSAVVAQVGAALVKNALRGDTNAQRAFLQMRGRWTVPQHVELTGRDGGPVQVEHRRKLVNDVLALVARGRGAATLEGEATVGGEGIPTPRRKGEEGERDGKVS